MSDLKCRTRSISKFLLLLLLSACGKVGDPQPPFIRVPEAVKDLAVTQSGDSLVLTWTNPPRYIDGSAATNLARVQIRSNGDAFAAVNVTASGQPQSYAIPLRGAIDGGRSFTVIVETTQGKVSATSNTTSITPVAVPGLISGLTAVPDQRRIFLKWDKPSVRPEVADAYVVTRVDVPAEAETVTDTQYEETKYQAGKTFTYQVTAARRVAGTLVMGVGPATTTVRTEDKTPPMVPAHLDIKTSEAGAYITWDPNAESDLAGY